MNRRMWVYAAVLSLVAIAAGGFTLAWWAPANPYPVLALSALALVLTNMAVELPFAVSLSLSFAPIFAGMLIAGPFGGALVGLACAVSWQEIRKRVPAAIILVNVAQLALAGMVGGWVLASLGGGFTSGSFVVRTSGPIAAAAAVMVFFALNLLLVGIGVRIKTGMGAREILRVLSPGSYWVSLLVLALLGYVMAFLITESSWLGLFLLVLPFMAVRRTFRVYAELTEAYTSTVRSLVAAIEAKDPYLRGHSERVAIYARRLAEALSLSRAESDLIERAALLHDVGKLGIDIDTLTSSTQLASEEVRAIRQHPVLGSNLVGDVEFLSDIVPIVRHHHERCDGAGYPDGLAGERIPALSRVLAVADCYDAMTSDRAYRPGMSKDEAMRELARVAGTQLDHAFAMRFIDLLKAEGQVQQ